MHFCILQLLYMYMIVLYIIQYSHIYTQSWYIYIYHDSIIQYTRWIHHFLNTGLEEDRLSFFFGSHSHTTGDLLLAKGWTNHSDGARCGLVCLWPPKILTKKTWTCKTKPATIPFVNLGIVQSPNHKSEDLGTIYLLSFTINTFIYIYVYVINVTCCTYIHVYHDGPLEINLKSIHFPRIRSIENHPKITALRIYFAHFLQVMKIKNSELGDGHLVVQSVLYCMHDYMWFWIKDHHDSPSDFVNLCAVCWTMFDFPSPPHTIFEASWQRAMIICCPLAAWKTWKQWKVCQPDRAGLERFLPSLEIPSPSIS